MACSECTFITPLKHHFQDHINSHDGFRPYPLSLCAYRGANLVMFKSHLETLKKYSCADCWYASTKAPQAHTNAENHKGATDGMFGMHIHHSAEASFPVSHQHARWLSSLSMLIVRLYRYEPRHAQESPEDAQIVQLCRLQVFFHRSPSSAHEWGESQGYHKALQVPMNEERITRVRQL